MAAASAASVLYTLYSQMADTREKLVPSHESAALEDKQKLQMKTFRELAECLARIPPKLTLYGLRFKYSYVGCLLLLMFSSDLQSAIKKVAYISEADPGFFLGGVALISCSTSTPINHIVFFFWRIPVVLENCRSS